MAQPTAPSARRCCPTDRRTLVPTAACAGASRMFDAAMRSDHGAANGAAAGRIVVIIPTLDEEQSIAHVVHGIPRPLVDRVIVADGGSRDATVARAQAAGAEVIDAGPGYGRACLAATTAAEDSESVGFMDGEAADAPQASA